MDEIRAQPGPQTEFLRSTADIVIFGGAMGGGKTFSLLMEAARYTYKSDYRGVIFRRTYPQIMASGGLWDESQKMYPYLGAVPRETDRSWTFASGAVVQFRHLEHEKNVHDYQGAQFAFIGFDEATLFTERQFWFLMQRNRSTCGVKPYIRLTCNPDPDSYVAGLIDWWIGEDGLPIHDRSGIVRYFVREKGSVHWADSSSELIEKTGCDPNAPKSLTFIPSRIYDNQILLESNPDYLANLMAQSEVDRERNLNGNWKIRQMGVIFSVPQYADMPDKPKIAFLDPAYGGGNCTALCIGCMDGTIHVTGRVWTETVVQCYSEILSELKAHNVGTLFVEANADKGACARDLYRLRGAGVALYNEHENKHIRIMATVKKHWQNIRFDHKIQREFINQVLNYEEGKEPDDAPDALAGLIRRLTVNPVSKKIRYTEVSL